MSRVKDVAIDQHLMDLEILKHISILQSPDTRIMDNGATSNCTACKEDIMNLSKNES